MTDRSEERIRIRIITMDDDEYFTTPPLTYTPKELQEKERERLILYPEEDPNFVCYLKYPCNYCGKQFYKVYPIRSEGLEPLRELYTIRTKHSNKLVGTCRRCLIDFSNRNESEFTNHFEGLNVRENKRREVS